MKRRRTATLLIAASATWTLGCDPIHVHAVTRDAPTEGVVANDSSAQSGDGEQSSTWPSLASDAAHTSEPTTTDEGINSSQPIGPSEPTSAPQSSGTGALSSDVTSCSGLTVSTGDTRVTVAVGSLERSYVLHVPLTADTTRPSPLIIDFHGAGGSGQDALENSSYPPVTDPEGVIMAFPDGVIGPIGAAWNVGPCCVPGVDDLAFVDALLADVQGRACIDVSRVYAVGVLTGGGMAHYLACQRSEVFAAVSPAAFDLVEETVDDCIPSLPVGVVAFRGKADERVPYEGGSSMLVPNMPVTFLGAEASFARWGSINGCTDEPTGPDARGCSAYSDCRGGVDVVLCSKENGTAEAGDATIAWPLLAQHAR